MGRLVGQQGLLRGGAVEVVAGGSVGAHHAVAGHDDGHQVGGARPAGGAYGPRGPAPFGQAAVGGGGAGGDAAQLPPRSLPERGARLGDVEAVQRGDVPCRVGGQGVGDRL